MSALVLALALLGGCSARPTASRPSPDAAPSALRPDGASGYADKPGWATAEFAVAAANPLATQAGYQILKSGGSAVDAAIAVQMVLALVEPQSSGIGGGAFLLHFDGKEVEAFDGRETAPAAATDRLFIGADGMPMTFHEAVVGGRSVGTPGAVRMLEMAHRQHGKLPWARLFEPAIALAENGFRVSARMHALLAPEPHLKKDPVALAYLYDAQGLPWPVGHLLTNPELAAVFRRVAADGSRALLEGEIAQAIVDKVQTHPVNPGRLALSDLAAYQARRRAPICFKHAGGGRNYRVCGMPPPSSGAIAIGQIMGMLDALGESAHPLDNGLPGAPWLHRYTEASRLAFADRARYLGDPDFVQPPAGRWTSLLAPSYLASRARLIGPRSMDAATPGEPGPALPNYGSMPHQDEYGTSHLSIVDRNGNALAMTTTIENAWGSRLMVNRGKGLRGGFLLNNQLTDFSFVPSDQAGVPIANRVEGGKRPRSSMAPTLVLDQVTGQLALTIGSPGGAEIIHYTAKALYGALDWGMNVQQAISLPNFGSVMGPLVLEQQRFPLATVQALRARGHQVLEQPMTSGLQGIQRTPSGFFGGADPRREGVVMGD